MEESAGFVAKGEPMKSKVKSCNDILQMGVVQF